MVVEVEVDRGEAEVAGRSKVLRRMRFGWRRANKEREKDGG